MLRVLLCCLLIGFLLFCFSQQTPVPPTPEQLRTFREGNSLFSQAESLLKKAGNDSIMLDKADKTYLQAMSKYQALLPSLKNKGQDSLRLFAGLKMGYIHYYFDSLDAAKQDYLASIAIQKNFPGIPDSILFPAFLYTGGIYYTQHDFDSASLFFKKAEDINIKYGGRLEGAERLYNRLGALYYETGNYKKAKNYIEKAISLTKPGDSILLPYYKINIASLLIKLESFEEARTLYNSLLPSPDFENEIYHNLAIISLREHQFHGAISYLKKVSYPNDKSSIDLYYNFGLAYSGMNQHDSAEFYIQRALAENVKWNGKRKNVQLGLILKYQADELARQQMYKEAVSEYQLAILQFDPAFTETGPDKNPLEFTGAYSFINLFNTLAAKATSFEGWYQQEKKIELLEAALDAYRTTFKLASYVEKTYDSDEARLFLGKIKYAIHSRPINVSLLLYDLTHKKNYLEEAYLFDQQNKASVLSANIEQQDFRNNNRENAYLESEEISLKKAITRLSINATRITDSQDLAAIHQNILTKEIALGKTREKLKADPHWQELMVAERIPTISDLQKKLDNTTAILSYHLSENELLILLITQSRFEYAKSIINKNFFNSIESFKTSLHEVEGNKTYNGNIIAAGLFDKLIGPVNSKLIQTKRLIIIPDDELHYLPFEALMDRGQKYLVERFSIQYQYSTALLNRGVTAKKSKGILSFAPFISTGYRDSTGFQLTALPASEKEVANLSGQVFKDKEATRDNFLKTVNQYGSIHLATHASVDNKDPTRSFIAFYPKDENYRLYAPEISNLALDSVQLVILSACETGTGQLVKGEGLMSLSRSFAYAGCPNIITSLWKAEDRTTAFLTQRLHHYLDENYTKDQALQQAKRDLLDSEGIDPQLKSPVFWAHLVFIGDYEPRQSKSRWWWIAFLFIAGAIVYKIIGKKKEPEA